jgi:hypothetical protein
MRFRWPMTRWRWARLLLGTGAAGVDARRLAADARLPGWALGQDRAMIPSRYSMRLWELVEHALGRGGTAHGGHGGAKTAGSSHARRSAATTGHGRMRARPGWPVSDLSARDQPGLLRTLHLAVDRGDGVRRQAGARGQ